MALDIFRLAVETPSVRRQENERPQLFPTVRSFR
jgi:hypothetical protein